MISYKTVKCVSNNLIGENVRHIILHPEEPLPFEAGQFFLVRLRDSDGELVERSYSIANYSQGDQIEFIVRIEPKGKMSTLINNFAPGDLMDVKGPFGRFGLAGLPDSAARLVLIAGGVGISPFRSILQKCFQLPDKKPIQLFYGFRTPQDFLFEAEFNEYKKTGRLEVIPCLSEGGQFPGWEKLSGHVTDFFDGRIFGPDEGTHSLICGPPPMVKSTREKLLAMGFERSHVHVEAW